MDVTDPRPRSAPEAQVKLRHSVPAPLAAQAEQKGAGLVSAAASGQFVCKGAITSSQECKLLVDRKFLEFMLL